MTVLAKFSTDLFQPTYPDAKLGDWELRQILNGGERGYWGELYDAREFAILFGPGPAGQTAWMSMAAVELQSQEIGIRAARGEVAVLGLGMGWVAANAALRDEVTRVTVVEIDNDIIELIHSSGIFDQLPPGAREKLTIVRDDALTWKPAHKVDTLIADIWLSLSEPGKFDQARRMQENIQAGQVYVWGQELEIGRCCHQRRPRETPDWPLIRSVVAAEIKLPLILPDWPDFGEKLAPLAEWWDL